MVSTQHASLAFLIGVLAQRYVSNDRFQLTDAQLKVPNQLSHDDWRKCLSSPMTLNRLRHLNRSEPLVIAQFIRRAADSGEILSSLDDERGHYTLHILPRKNSYRVVIKLSAEYLNALCPKEKCQHVMLRLIHGEIGNRSIYELEALQPNLETAELIWNWPQTIDATPSDCEITLVLTNPHKNLQVYMRKINAFFPQVQKCIAQMVVNRMGSIEQANSLAHALMHEQVDMRTAVRDLLESLRSNKPESPNPREWSDFSKYVAKRKKTLAVQEEADLNTKSEYATELLILMKQRMASYEEEEEHLVKAMLSLRKTLKRQQPTEIASFLFRNIENSYCSELRWRALANQYYVEEGIVVTPNYLKVLSRVNKRRGELEHLLSNPSVERNATLLSQLLRMDERQLLSGNVYLGLYHETHNKAYAQLLLDYDRLEVAMANQQLAAGEAKHQNFDCKKYNNINKPERMQAYLDCLVHAQQHLSVSKDDGYDREYANDDNPDYDDQAMGQHQNAFDDSLFYEQTDDEESPISKMLKQFERMPDHAKAAALKLLNQDDRAWPDIAIEYGMTAYHLKKEGWALIERIRSDEFLQTA